LKRDLDLCRSILLKIDADPKFNGRTGHLINDTDQFLFSFEGHSLEEVDYNLNLLREAGLIDAQKTAEPGAIIRKLTWEGHEFLNDTSDPDIWSKTKERARGVANIGFGFLWEIAKAEIKTRLGLP